MRNAILAVASLLALAACGAEPEATLDTAAAVAPAAEIGACGAKLPITGLCSTADNSYFLKVDTGAEKLATQCIWRTHEVSYADNMALVFRAQDCTAEGWVPNLYEFVQGYVKFRMDGTPSDQAMFILEVMPVTAGETPEQAAIKTLGKAPEDQRARCETRPLQGPVVAGNAFELAPNADFESELNGLYPDEPWDACGPNGVTQDAAQFWEARNGYALFHMLGQDDPQWDPASFTFYRRGDDGVWAKAG